MTRGIRSGLSLAFSVCAVACLAVVFEREGSARPWGGSDGAGSSERIGQLTAAAAAGDEPAVRGLLEAGVPVDGRDYSNATALHAAVRAGHERIVALLLERGADRNAAYVDGQTPLMLALVSGYNEYGNKPLEEFDETITLLLKAKVQLEARNTDGETALLIAARNRDRGRLRQLVEAGADVNAARKDGQTALSISLDEVAPDNARLLFESGAKATAWVRLKYWLFRFARLQAWCMPPVLVIVFLFAMFNSRLRPKLPEKHRVDEGDGLPRLKPLKCSSCGAPVPIETATGRCPSCDSGFEVPEDYRETVRLRTLASRNLQRAIRGWRLAALVHASPVAWFFRIVGPAWLVATYLGVAGGFGDASYVLAISSIVGGWVFGIGLFAFGVFLVWERKRVPPMPHVGREAGEAEEIGCSTCGAPAAFAANVLARACEYCGTDLFRAAIARQARRTAARESEKAGQTAYEALLALQHAREAFLHGILITGYFVITALLAILGLGVWEWITS